MSYEVFEDGVSTEKVAVNCSSKEDAERVYRQWENVTGTLDFKILNIRVPKFFRSCLMNRNDF